MTFNEFCVLILVGLLAGWLAGLVMRGGFGILGSIALGIVGAVVGGLLFEWIGVKAYGFPARVGVAVVGSIVILGLARMIRGGPAAARR
jgi:uncharacterized membrane protein YeaQ/YmgE (transglycosylase-associated protein family)